MVNTKKSPKGSIVELPFHCIRKVSSPEDIENNRIVYSGQLPIASIVDLSTNENVRGYLREAEGKSKRTPTKVHIAILDTLKECPDQFSVLNGGVVIVASSCEVFEKQRTLELVQPSIINGSQTQGVIKDFIAEKGDTNDIHIKFELIITDDDDLIAEISIARNFQNDVQSISIAGRRGQLDELEKKLQKDYPSLRLQKSETELPADDTNYIQTEKLLQVIAALLPRTLWWKPGEFNKVYTYSRKATCLKDFQEVFEGRSREGDPGQKRFEAIYQFYLDMAPQAYTIYERWKQHQGFAGCGLRSIERDSRMITDVPDGLIFPIIASLSEFTVKTKSGWTISMPKQLDETELIRTAKSAYMEIAKSKPEIMGKTKACYSALQQITAIYKKLS
jgi:hypothetical protein